LLLYEAKVNTFQQSHLAIT